MAQKPQRTPLEKLELKEFSQRLTDLLARRGLSQSDLAREVWGSVTDTRGRDVARNRDRISHYVRGSQMPEPKTMAAIAKVLGVELAELNPALDRNPSGAPPEKPILTVFGGRPDLALISIERVVPMRIAVQMLSLLADADEAAHTE